MKKSRLLFLLFFLILPIFLILLGVSLLGSLNIVYAVTCGDNPAEPSSGYKWKADCSRTCAVTTDGKGSPACPQNTFDPSNVNPTTSNWCYDFDPADASGNCLMLVRPGCESAGTSGCGITGAPSGVITCNPSSCERTGDGPIGIKYSWSNFYNDCRHFRNDSKPCSYVGADICIKRDDQSDWQRPFADSTDLNPPNEGSSGYWPRGLSYEYDNFNLEAGHTYTFGLFEDSFTCSVSGCQARPDSEGGQRSRNCSGKLAATKTVRVLSSSASAAPTCTINVSSSSVSAGSDVSLTYSGNANAAGAKPVSMFISKADGTALGTSIGELVTNRGKYYYKIDTCNSTDSAACGTTRNVAALPAGDYVAFCNAETGSSLTQCSGNPFCGSNGATSSTPGGTIDCSQWKSCSGTANQRGGDNVAFTVTADTSCPADIRSTQVKMRAGEQDVWTTELTMSLGRTILVAGFHNNQIDTLADNIVLTATGPDGPQSHVVTLNNNNNNVPFTPTLAGRYTITASKQNKTGSNCTGTAVLTVNPAAMTTSHFRIAESPAGLNNAPWQPYIAEPMQVNFEFTANNAIPGPKFVWVEFKDSTGKIERHNAQIKLLGTGPSNIGCSLGFEGSDTILNISGQNFGADKGKVNNGETDLLIRSWTDTSVRAVWSNAPIGQTLNVTLTDVDGQEAAVSCNAAAQLALGAKVFCRAPSSHQTSNVIMILAGDFPGGGKTRQKVSIDKDGVIQGLNQKLETGKNYILSLKAPYSLRRNKPFTVEAGTATLNDFILPIGDIFPADSGDGAINSFDHNELVRQWNIASDVTGRIGDFNQDGRVNSIDWACMRYDFGQSADPEPAPNQAISTSTTTIGIGSSAAQQNNL